MNLRMAMVTNKDLIKEISNEHDFFFEYELSSIVLQRHDGEMTKFDLFAD
jgi:hypothetical protein